MKSLSNTAESLFETRSQTKEKRTIEDKALVIASCSVLRKIPWWMQALEETKRDI